MKTALTIIGILLLAGGALMLFLELVVYLAVFLLIAGIALILYIVFKAGRTVESFTNQSSSSSQKRIDE